MKLENLSFRDRFDILLEKRLSGVAELRYKMLYGQSQIIVMMAAKLRKDLGFYLFLGIALAVGAFLRLYMLSEQILLDDEWHGVHFIIDKTFKDVVITSDSFLGSSPPFNLYRFLLYHTSGWSELALRLPAVSAGLLALIILPILLKKIFNERMALIFVFLLAVSPFSVFYSRFSRAYSVVMLLAFCALLLFYLWLSTAKHRYATGFLLVSVFAIYTHLFSIVAILTPMVVAFIIRFFTKAEEMRRKNMLPLPSYRALLGMSFILIIALSFLLRPIFLQGSKYPWIGGKLVFKSFLTVMQLISGVANAPLNIVFYVLCITGFIFLAKCKRHLAWLFLAVVCAYFIALIIARPIGLETAIVILRYSIVVIPITLSVVAFMVDNLCSVTDKALSAIKYRQVLSGLITTTFILLLFITGPLPETYSSPNNFTNHSTYQGSYGRHTWQQSEARHVKQDYVISRQQVPRFYNWLKQHPEYKSIIEYPYDVCNHYNLFYYYQHFHKKNVIAGYSSLGFMGYKLDKTQESMANKDIIWDMLCADTIFPWLYKKDKLKFRNMLDITDMDNILRSQADFIVLHRMVVMQKILPDRTETIPLHYRSVPYFSRILQKVFGPPVYEDSLIICYQIKRGSAL